MIDLTTLPGAASPKARKIVERLTAAQRARQSRTNTREVEFKQLEITHCPVSGLTFVLSEVGAANDEGTAAAIFCRDRRLWAITRRGGISLLNAKIKRQANGFFNATTGLVR